MDEDLAIIIHQTRRFVMLGDAEAEAETKAEGDGR